MPEYTEAGGEALSGPEVRELYEDLRGAHSARNAEYSDAREKYEGDHWDNVNLRAEEGRASMTVNYVRPAVDKAVEDLFGMMPGLQVVPRGADEENRRHAEGEENLLYATWAYNGMERILRQVAFNVVLLRRGFLQMWWDPTAKRVRYSSIAPENVYPVMDGNEVVEFVVVSERLTRSLKAKYPRLAGQIGSDVEGDDIQADVSRPAGGPSRLTQRTRVIDWYDRHGNWVRVMGEAVHRQKLGYGFDHPPVYEFVNNVAGDGLEPHSVIDDIIELNQYLDQVFSQQADIIAKYSNPPVVDKGSGQSPQAIRQAIRANGSVIPVRRDGDLKYLNWEGTLPEISPQIERTLSFIRDLSGQPATAFGETVTNQSGVMTNLSLTPTVKSTQAREALFGATLALVNADTLRIYEAMLKGNPISIQGVRFGKTPYQRRPFAESEVTSQSIDGWYENRIKWPSALRIDDPVYVQTELSKMTSDPPAQSVYDTMENLGVEDVEAALDRIAAQLEDPRFHPDRMESAIGAATSLADSELPTDLEGFADPVMNDAAEAVGSPDRSALVDLAG